MEMLEQKQFEKQGGRVPETVHTSIHHRNATPLVFTKKDRSPPFRNGGQRSQINTPGRQHQLNQDLEQRFISEKAREQIKETQERVKRHLMLASQRRNRARSTSNGRTPKIKMFEQSLSQNKESSSIASQKREEPIFNFQVEAIRAAIGKNIVSELENEEQRYRNMNKLVGLKLHHFKMIRQVGHGHFGKIMMAKYEPPFNLEDEMILARLPLKLETFALKMIKMSAIHKDKQIEHLKNEKAVLTKVSDQASLFRHSNMFLQMHGTFQHEDMLILITNYINGFDLHHFQHNHMLSIDFDLVLLFCAQALQMLSFLHFDDIVFRDLKPENLMLDFKLGGQLRLVDFGFAKVLGKKGRTATKCGSPGYIAPEVLSVVEGRQQPQGKHAKKEQGYGFECDVWSWGVLLCELVGGFNPFYSPDIIQIYQNILTMNVNYPRNIDQGAKELLQNGIFISDPNLRFTLTQIKESKLFSKVSWDDPSQLSTLCKSPNFQFQSKLLDSFHPQLSKLASIIERIQLQNEQSFMISLEKKDLFEEVGESYESPVQKHQYGDASPLGNFHLVKMHREFEDF